MSEILESQFAEQWRVPMMCAERAYFVAGFDVGLAANDPLLGVGA